MAIINTMLEQGEVKHITVEDLKLTPIVDDTNVPNNSFWVNSSDSNKLMWKNNLGNSLYVFIN